MPRPSDSRPALGCVVNGGLQPLSCPGKSDDHVPIVRRMKPQGSDEQAITEKTTDRLAQTLPNELDRAHIEATVRDQVRELRSTARVHNFIEIIAERNARKRLLEDVRRGA